MKAQTQSRYDILEDICLGKALMHYGLTLTGSDFTIPRTCLEDVHSLFVQQVARFCIDTPRRTPRSLLDHAKILRRNFKDGSLSFDARQGDSLERERYVLFSQIFRGEGHPCAVGSRPAHHSPKMQPVLTRRRQEDASQDRKPVILRETRHGRIHKDKPAGAKRILEALSRIHKHRTDILMKREENDREQQEIVHRAQRWKRDMIKRAVTMQVGDGVPDFLKTLEDMYVNDVKVYKLHEDTVRERIRIDRENCEWEQSTFETFMKHYID